MIDKINVINKDSKYLELINKIKSGQDGSCFGLNFNEISFILSSNSLFLSAFWIVSKPAFNISFKKMSSLMLEDLSIKFNG